MSRRRRSDEISQYHLQEIERQMRLLEIALDAAHLSLRPFSRHYDAIDGFKKQMRETTNLLMDRPIDYERPHAAPMSGPGERPPGRNLSGTGVQNEGEESVQNDGAALDEFRRPTY